MHMYIDCIWFSVDLICLSRKPTALSISSLGTTVKSKYFGCVKVAMLPSSTNTCFSLRHMQKTITAVQWIDLPARPVCQFRFARFGWFLILSRSHWVSSFSKFYVYIYLLFEHLHSSSSFASRREIRYSFLFFSFKSCSAVFLVFSYEHCGVPLMA